MTSHLKERHCNTVFKFMAFWALSTWVETNITSFLALGQFSVPPNFVVVQSLCRAKFFETLWTVARQAPLPMGFSRQEHRRGLLFPPLGESSWLMDRAHISCLPCISRQILYSWDTWEAPLILLYEMWEWKSLSCVWLFVTPWTIESMGFSRPEYWSG